MAMVDPAEHQTDAKLGGTMTRAVGDDMVAIFGSGSRDATSTFSTGERANARYDRPGRRILVTGVGMLAAMIAAGVYVGNGVIVAPATSAAPRAAHRAARAVNHQALGSNPVIANGATAETVRPSPINPLVASPMRQAQSASAMTVDAAEPRLLQPNRKALPAAIPPVRVLPAASSVSQLPASPRSSCNGSDAECLAQRVDAAEERVADAYDQALRAGVGRRDLRGYRAEWDRARDVVSDQPRYALRLYAMIASDLYSLADDADALDEPTR